MEIISSGGAILYMQLELIALSKHVSLYKMSDAFSRRFREGNFLPELCGEVDPETAPLRALSCALCSTEQRTFRGGERGRRGAERGVGRGVASKGGNFFLKFRSVTIRGAQPGDSSAVIWGGAKRMGE